MLRHAVWVAIVLSCALPRMASAQDASASVASDDTPPPTLRGAALHFDGSTTLHDEWGTFVVGSVEHVHIEIQGSSDADLAIERLDGPSETDVVSRRARDHFDSTGSDSYRYEGTLAPGTYAFRGANRRRETVDVVHDSGTHFELHVVTTADQDRWLGAGIETSLRGWYGEQRVVGWGVSAVLTSWGVACSQPVHGWCPPAGRSPGGPNLMIETLSVPFDILLGLDRSLRAVVEVAPSLAWAIGEPGGRTYASAAVLGGFDYVIDDVLSLIVRAGYRFWADDLDGSSPMWSNVVGPGFVGRIGIGVDIG